MSTRYISLHGKMWKMKDIKDMDKDELLDEAMRVTKRGLEKTQQSFIKFSGEFQNLLNKYGSTTLELVMISQVTKNVMQNIDDQLMKYEKNEGIKILNNELRENINKSMISIIQKKQ